MRNFFRRFKSIEEQVEEQGFTLVNQGNMCYRGVDKINCGMYVFDKSMFETHNLCRSDLVQAVYIHFGKVEESRVSCDSKEEYERSYQVFVKFRKI